MKVILEPLSYQHTEDILAHSRGEVGAFWPYPNNLDEIDLEIWRAEKAARAGRAFNFAAYDITSDIFVGGGSGC